MSDPRGRVRRVDGGQRLLWTGQVTSDGAVPAPEGWPAEDHDEPDAASAAMKLASGLYVSAKES